VDPNACLDRILENLADLHTIVTGGEIDLGEREESIHALRELADWLERGGFPPDCDARIRQWGG
jgi:hypothetical protein